MAFTRSPLRAVIKFLKRGGDWVASRVTPSCVRCLLVAKPVDDLYLVKHKPDRTEIPSSVALINKLDYVQLNDCVYEFWAGKLLLSVALVFFVR